MLKSPAPQKIKNKFKKQKIEEGKKKKSTSKDQGEEHSCAGEKDSRSRATRSTSKTLELEQNVLKCYQPTHLSLSPPFHPPEKRNVIGNRANSHFYNKSPHNLVTSSKLPPHLTLACSATEEPPSITAATHARPGDLYKADLHATAQKLL